MMGEFTFDKLAAALRNRLGQGRVSQQIEAALRLAWKGHNGQYRERSNSGDPKIPYIVHPVGVALLALDLMPLVDLPDSLDDIVSVCLTHDLIEDCDITAHEIANVTSRRTSELVDALTKPPSKTGGGSRRRNEEAFGKIVDAGPSAMFIKICDHLQNISRPQYTPPTLLKKALRKGWELNLGYFETGALSEELKNEYVRRLRVAEECHRVLSNGNEAAQAFSSLTEAIGYCVNHTETKILEAHDIIDIIKAVSGARFALLSSADRFIDLAFNSKALRANQKFSARLKTLINEGTLSTSAIPKDIAGSFVLDIDRIVAIPLQFETSSRAVSDLLFVGLQFGTSADWVNSDSLRVLISFLSDRLRQQVRKNHVALSNRVAELGLRINTDDAERLRLGYSDLDKLVSVLRRADFVRESIVARLIYEFDWAIVKSEFPRIESRTKEAASLIRKMISKKCATVAELDDVIGIRVICGTEHEANIAAQRAIEIIRSAFEHDGSLFGFRVLNTTLDAVTSVAGYRARHLTCMVMDDIATSIAIGCEIQFRSAFQDAWARLSHDLNYKAQRSKGRLVEEGMVQLAAMRDQMDEYVNTLIAR